MYIRCHPRESRDENYSMKRRVFSFLQSANDRTQELAHTGQGLYWLETPSFQQHLAVSSRSAVGRLQRSRSLLHYLWLPPCDHIQSPWQLMLEGGRWLRREKNHTTSCVAETGKQCTVQTSLKTASWDVVTPFSNEGHTWPFKPALRKVFWFSFPLLKNLTI